MATGRNEGGADSSERDFEQVVRIPELTEEAEERIFAKIQASIGESEGDRDDSQSPAG
jgi:hypothetical protein